MKKVVFICIGMTISFHAYSQRMQGTLHATYVAGGAGWRPFLAIKNKRPHGIVPGIVSWAAKKSGYNLKFEDLGSDAANDKGLSIVSAISKDSSKNEIWCTGPTTKEWVPKEYRPHVSFSEPILRSRQILLFRKNASNLPVNLKTLKNMTVATCKGYRYVLLDNLFENKKLMRSDHLGSHDTPCDLATLNSVKNGKADFAPIDEHVYGYLIKQKKIEPDVLKAHPENLSAVELRLACSQNSATQRFLDILGATIVDMQNSNFINKIVDEYSK